MLAEAMRIVIRRDGVHPACGGRLGHIVECRLARWGEQRRGQRHHATKPSGYTPQQ